MALTLDQLRTSGCSAVGLDAGQLDTSEATRIDAAINEALVELASARPWPRYGAARLILEIPAGSSYVLLPADFVRFDGGVRLAYAPDTAERSLGKMDVGQIDELRSAGTQTGVPQFYALGAVESGRTALELWPTSDLAYALRGLYRRRPARLVAGTDEADVEPEMEPALRTGIKIAVHREFNKGASAMPELFSALSAQTESAWTTLATPDRTVHQLREVVRTPLGNYPRGQRVDLTDAHPI